ncbi:MAG: hypothetical protein A3E88_04760 [Legionellales bacterium RIFCSPHIGHO2_12_FULL_35_11]|nr:MAG: hypothetical protein A3E88_04760 [Legionellales bacterium RIFCSPHIGHO2_12_FULL_35_11]
MKSSDEMIEKYLNAIDYDLGEHKEMYASQINNMFNGYDSFREGIIISLFIIPNAIFLLKNLLRAIYFGLRALFAGFKNEGLNEFSVKNFNVLGYELAELLILTITTIPKLLVTLLTPLVTLLTQDNHKKYSGTSLHLKTIDDDVIRFFTTPSKVDQSIIDSVKIELGLENREVDFDL